MVRDDQPDAREGRAGCLGMTERPVVPLEPGNAGGGKGPRFKTEGVRGENVEIGNLSNVACSERLVREVA